MSLQNDPERYDSFSGDRSLSIQQGLAPYGNNTENNVVTIEELARLFPDLVKNTLATSGGGSTGTSFQPSQYNTFGTNNPTRTREGDKSPYLQDPEAIRAIQLELSLFLQSQIDAKTSLFHTSNWQPIFDTILMKWNKSNPQRRIYLYDTGGKGISKGSYWVSKYGMKNKYEISQLFNVVFPKRVTQGKANHNFKTVKVKYTVDKPVQPTVSSGAHEVVLHSGRQGDQPAIMEIGTDDFRASLNPFGQTPDIEGILKRGKGQVYELVGMKSESKKKG